MSGEQSHLKDFIEKVEEFIKDSEHNILELKASSVTILELKDKVEKLEISNKTLGKLLTQLQDRVLSILRLGTKKGHGEYGEARAENMTYHMVDLKMCGKYGE